MSLTLSNSPEMFYKVGVLKNGVKFKGKHMRRSLFFDRVAVLIPATLLKVRLRQIGFPVNFEQHLKTLFKEHLRVAASELV